MYATLRPIQHERSQTPAAASLATAGRSSITGPVSICRTGRCRTLLISESLSLTSPGFITISPTQIQRTRSDDQVKESEDDAGRRVCCIESEVHDETRLRKAGFAKARAELLLPFWWKVRLRIVACSVATPPLTADTAGCAWCRIVGTVLFCANMADIEASPKSQ